VRGVRPADRDAGPAGLRVQDQQCATCIYRADSPLNLAALEAAIADPHLPGCFHGHRVCHHSKDAVCRGFWNRHRDNCTGLVQIAQRLGMVVFVHDDTLSSEEEEE
jgi:hypothetical protein